jgi:plasmid maintenance system antidote protein VapI
MHSRTPLARWFRSSGITPAAAARTIGVSRVSLYHYINAASVPTEPTISRLAALTGLSVAELSKRRKMGRGK